MVNLLVVLSFASTLGFAIAQDSKSHRIADKNIIVLFGEESVEADARSVLSLAGRALRQFAEKSHLSSVAPVEIHLAGTTAEFCQRTGRPWWQGAVYRTGIIHLQPVRVLRERGILEITLRHELLHQLVDEHSKGNCPSWLSEALAIYNSGEIAVIKPAQKWTKSEGLKWHELERRLQTATRKEELDRLYFQLYHLGWFLEREFRSEQIGKLIFQLGAKSSFDQACRDVFGISAKEIERRWLQYWTDMARGKIHKQ
jgi:hypothetical protein